MKRWMVKLGWLVFGMTVLLLLLGVTVGQMNEPSPHHSFSTQQSQNVELVGMDRCWRPCFWFIRLCGSGWGGAFYLPFQGQ